MTAPHRRTLLGASLGASLGAGLAAPLFFTRQGRAQGQYKAEYKLSTVGNRPVPHADGAFRWAELVTERTGGRITVKTYPGSQLVGGDQTRELVALRQGVIDFVNFSTINISPQIREMNLFSLPFLMPDHRAFDALIEGEAGRDLFRTIEARDAVPLAWGENGFRELSNSRRPIRAPADLRGLKIRFAAGAIFSEIFTALGANPVQMSFADLQPALSTGAVDGQENPTNLFLALRMDSLSQRHLTVWNYVADAGIMAVAKPVWEGFTAADREIVRESAREAARQQLAGTRRGLGLDGDRSSLDELARRNVEVVSLSREEKAAFARATRPVYDKWAATVGTELVRRAEAAIQRATA